MSNDSLGDRMKNYENSFRQKLPTRLPVIIRIDGCHFHTYTKGLQKPVDQSLVDVMNETAMYLCKNIQGAQLAYVQSDEISILVHNYKEIETQSWFDNTLQKMVSVSAGMASAVFTSLSPKIFGVHKLAIFDSRTFIVPEADVNNYFLWRQQDATRNSVQMLARSLYSHKQCEDKNNSELQELCHEKGVNWNDCPTSQKRGRCIVKITAFCDGKDPRTGEVTKSLRTKWTVDNEIPIFSQDKSYINGYLLTTEAAELAQIT